MKGECKRTAQLVRVNAHRQCTITARTLILQGNGEPSVSSNASVYHPAPTGQRQAQGCCSDIPVRWLCTVGWAAVTELHGSPDRLVRG